MKKVLILLLMFTKLNAIKIDRVIMATDTNTDYIEFWPIVAKAWKEIVGIKPTLALIANKDVKIDETIGDVIRFEPIEGVTTGLYAQAIRLLLPAYFPDEVCLTSDIDLVPLNKEYFLNSPAYISDDCFVIYRDVAYRMFSDKFPMMFTAAKGRVFQEVFRITNIESIPEIIKSWSSRNLGWYTDEILLHECLTNWKDYKNRCMKLGHNVERRIDRSYWNYDVNLLKTNYYIDMHCARPYSKYKKDIDTIVETVIQSNSKHQKINIFPRSLADESGTHMVPLLTTIANTKGPIMELCCSDYSTPLLHAICTRSKRFLLTAHTDKRLLNYFVDLKNDWHEFQYVPVYEDDWSVNPKPNMWDKIGLDKHWSVVLINHRPGERRVDDIRRLRNNTDVFVVHDTESPAYCYEPVINSFKYKYVYTRYATQTTVVSDIIDVSKFFEE